MELHSHTLFPPTPCFGPYPTPKAALGCQASVHALAKESCPLPAVCSMASRQIKGGKRSWLAVTSQSLHRPLLCHHSLKGKGVKGTIDKDRPHAIPSLPGNQTLLITHTIFVGGGSGFPREDNEKHTHLAELTFPFWHVVWDALSAQFEI